ncbi:MAG: hypothetical protein ABSG92_00540 [Conexivisphaerales archaeon]
MQTRTGKASVEVKNLKNPVSGAMVEKSARKVRRDRNIVKKGIFVYKSCLGQAQRSCNSSSLKLLTFRRTCSMGSGRHLESTP